MNFEEIEELSGNVYQCFPNNENDFFFQDFTFTPQEENNSFIQQENFLTANEPTTPLFAESDTFSKTESEIGKLKNECIQLGFRFRISEVQKINDQELRQTHIQIYSQKGRLSEKKSLEKIAHLKKLFEYLKKEKEKKDKLNNNRNIPPLPSSFNSSISRQENNNIFKKNLKEIENGISNKIEKFEEYLLPFKQISNNKEQSLLLLENDIKLNLFPNSRLELFLKMIDSLRNTIVEKLPNQESHHEKRENKNKCKESMDNFDYFNHLVLQKKRKIFR